MAASACGGSADGGSAAPDSNAPAYSTSFGFVETPISEGGRWLRNRANPWTDVVTANGRAFGTNGRNDTFDDSYAYLSGFPPNVAASAVVFRDAALNIDITHEVELLFRVADSHLSVRGYECLFAHFGSVQIWRWNDRFGDFTLLGEARFPRELVTGDVVSASMAGDTIVCHVNDEIVVQASDGMWRDGQPGIGFFTRPGGNSAHFACEAYSVTAL